MSNFMFKFFVKRKVNNLLKEDDKSQKPTTRDVLDDVGQSFRDMGNSISNQSKKIFKTVSHVNECEEQFCSIKRVSKGSFCSVHTCRTQDCFEKRIRVGLGYCKAHLN